MKSMGCKLDSKDLNSFLVSTKNFPVPFFLTPPALPLSGFSTDKRAYRERKPER